MFLLVFFTPLIPLRYGYISLLFGIRNKMTRLSRIDDTALDILSLLHFYEVLTTIFINKQQINCYNTIHSLIKNILSDHEITGEFAEIFEHYLLCGLEILLGGENDDDYPYPKSYYDNSQVSEEINKKVCKYRNDFSLATLSILAKENGIDADLFFILLDKLGNNDYIAKIPPFIRHRLVVQYFSFHFPNSTLLFYRQLIDLRIMESKKYQEKSTNSTKKAKNTFRAGLVIEFEVFRKEIPFMMGKNNAQMQLVIESPKADITKAQRNKIKSHYKRLSNYLFESKKNALIISFNVSQNKKKEYIEQFLQNVSRSNYYYQQKLLFRSTKASLIGTIGALQIEKQKMEKPKIAIYCESDNTKTVSNHVSEKLKEQGFYISPRTLYLRHKKFKKKEYLIMQYYNLVISKLSFVFEWSSEDPFYDGIPKDSIALNFFTKSQDSSDSHNRFLISKIQKEVIEPMLRPPVKIPKMDF
jgi:hypothetical protein